jgi:hypothetical protein
MRDADGRHERLDAELVNFSVRYTSDGAMLARHGACGVAEDAITGLQARRRGLPAAIQPILK